MGVRPSIAFVCGINDADPFDERYSDPGFNVWERELTVEEDNDLFLGLGEGGRGQSELYFDQLYLDGNPQSGLKHLTVVGYIIDEAGEDMARALDDCFGWKTEDQVFVIKPKPIPSEYVQKAYAQRDGKDAVESANRENRWMDTFTPWYTDLYYQRAIYILHQAGWTGVTREMLKFMIVSYWS